MIYPMEEINNIMENITHRFKNITNLPFFQVDKVLQSPPEDISEDPFDTAQVLNITKLNFETINAIIEDGRLWRVLKGSERLHLASTILQLINDLGSLLNSKLDFISEMDSSSSTYTTSLSSLLIQSRRFTVFNGAPDQILEFNLEHTRVELPLSGLENSTLIEVSENQTRNISATVVLIRNLTARLSTPKTLQVNSRIVSLIIEDEAEIELLDEPLRYRLWHLHRLEFFDAPLCAFWDFNSSSWDGECGKGGGGGGCTYRVDESSRYASTCECSQLRSNVFAIVVDVSSQEGEILAKSILTYIASGVTCLFLGLAVYILVEYQEVAKGREIPLFPSLEGRRGRRSSRSLREINLKKETNKVSLAINISIYLLLTHVFTMFGFNLSNRVIFVSQGLSRFNNF